MLTCFTPKSTQGKHELSQETKDHLHRQLVLLGDKMGDGEHLEPGGRWIEREYGKICRALGLIPKRRRDTSVVDKAMARRVADFPCPECGGVFKQLRKGSVIGECLNCGVRYRLLKKERRKPSC